MSTSPPMKYIFTTSKSEEGCSEIDVEEKVEDNNMDELITSDQGE